MRDALVEQPGQRRRGGQAADGDALVLHVGERPYVVAASGQVELSTRALTLEAISGILGQLISPASEKALEELGAVEHELAQLAAIPDERFVVVAARGGNDIWMEIRRHRHQGTHASVSSVTAAVEEPVASAPPPAVEPDDRSSPLMPSASAGEQAFSSDMVAAESKPEADHPPLMAERAAEAPRPVEPKNAATATPQSETVETPEATSSPAVSKEVPRSTPRRRRTDRFPVEADIPPVTMVPVPPSRVQTPRSPLEEATAAGIVLPLARSQVRGDQGTRVAMSPKLAGLDRLLRVAAARGASTLYLVSGSKPSIRVDGEISQLEGEAVLSAPEVESLLRLREEGLRVVEIPVDMRERAGGKSKLRGSKAVRLVLTVTGTLLGYTLGRRHRGR